MQQAMRFKSWVLIFMPAVVLGVALWGWSQASSDQRVSSQTASLARSLLEALDSPAGFCVHLGVSDGTLTTALSDNGKYLVHALASDEAGVEATRQQIEATNLAGIVSVQKGSWDPLPYADNLANLIVVENLPVVHIPAWLRLLSHAARVPGIGKPTPGSDAVGTGGVATRAGARVWPGGD